MNIKDRILVGLRLKNKPVENEKANTKIYGEGVVCHVRRKYNNDTMQTIFKFVAVERRNDAANVELVNNSYDFKEEIDPDTYEKITDLEKQIVTKQTLEYLELDDKLGNIDSREEKLKTISKMIKDQENLVGSIKNNKVTVKVTDKLTKEVTEHVKDVNVIDERNKLRFLKVLKEHYENFSSSGGYEWLDENGNRQRFFNWVDGFLYPVKENIPLHTVYTEMTTKRKEYKVESDILDKDFAEDTKTPISDFMKNIFIIILMLLIGLFGFALVKVLAYKSDLDLQRDGSVECTYVLPNWVNNQSVALTFVEETNEALFPKEPTLGDNLKQTVVDLTER